MSGALAVLLLAAATLVLPVRTAATVRLGRIGVPAVCSAAGRTPNVGDRRAARRTRGPLLPLAAATSVGCWCLLTIAWPSGPLVGSLCGVVVFLGCRWLLRIQSLGVRDGGRADPLLIASGWDLLAACLRGGLPVPTAVRAVAGEVPGQAGDALRRTAELIALGADPVEAWAPALRHPVTAELARGARRTARSGAALAGVAEALAADVRAAAHDLAEARAQRAAVAVTAPLGLCFLPAFLCLGVVPVVIGLAARLMASW